MSSPAQTAYENETLQTAATRMLTLGIRRLPVLDDDGRLTGILSRHDLLDLAHRTDSVIARDVASALASPVSCPEDHGVRMSCVAQGVVYIEGWTPRTTTPSSIFDVLRSIPGVLDVRGGIGRGRPTTLRSTSCRHPSTPATAPEQSHEPSPERGVHRGVNASE